MAGWGTSTFPGTATLRKAGGSLLCGFTTNGTPKMLWTPWTVRSWTGGSCGSRWPGTADPPTPTTVEGGGEDRRGGTVATDGEAEGKSKRVAVSLIATSCWTDTHRTPLKNLANSGLPWSTAQYTSPTRLKVSSLLTSKLPSRIRHISNNRIQLKKIWRLFHQSATTLTQLKISDFRCKEKAA